MAPTFVTREFLGVLRNVLTQMNIWDGNCHFLHMMKKFVGWLAIVAQSRLLFSHWPILIRTGDGKFIPALIMGGTNVTFKISSVQKECGLKYHIMKARPPLD